MGSEVLTFISTVKNLTIQAPRSNKHFYECKNIAILKLRFCSCLVETFVQLKNYFSADNLLSTKHLRFATKKAAFTRAFSDGQKRSALHL